jgi:hypothetical protein
MNHVSELLRGWLFAATRGALVTVLVLGLAGIALVAARPAQAHQRDVMTPNRAGPIVRSETTLWQLRRWFGPPTARRVVRVGCVDVIRARWDDDLAVYATQGYPRTVAAIFVRSPQLTSAAHGDLGIHTREGLRVGDRQRKLRRLYPESEAITHDGHTHYRLRTNRYGAYLMAKVVNRRVVQLEAWPYEFC